MKVASFFKILNKKIEQYDKIVSNPFLKPQPIILIWVEDYAENDKKKTDFE